MKSPSGRRKTFKWEDFDKGGDKRIRSGGKSKWNISGQLYAFGFDRNARMRKSTWQGGGLEPRVSMPLSEACP